MSTRYQADPSHSRFTVQAFATGLLSMFAHSPTFAVRDYAADVMLDPGTFDGARVQLSARADSLQVLDQVRPADRADIEGRMRQEVLQTATFPEVRFDGDRWMAGPIAPNEYRLRIAGQLALHGTVRPREIDATVQIFGDGIRLTGECPLNLSEYGIRPVTALGGAIQLRDQLRVAFDLVCWKDGQKPEGL
jgi:polyisoprenoid-binding protein YceI